MKKLTPLHIHLLLHYHAIAEPIGEQFCGGAARVRFTRDLERWGMIRADTDSPSGYRSTDGGSMLVDALCSTPIPRRTLQWTMCGREDGQCTGVGGVCECYRRPLDAAEAIRARVAEASAFKLARMCPFHTGRACVNPTCSPDAPSCPSIECADPPRQVITHLGVAVGSCVKPGGCDCLNNPRADATDRVQGCTWFRSNGERF